jgi:hypothetical protein
MRNPFRLQTGFKHTGRRVVLAMAALLTFAGIVAIVLGAV